MPLGKFSPLEKPAGSAICLCHSFMAVGMTQTSVLAGLTPVPLGSHSSFPRKPSMVEALSHGEGFSSWKASPVVLKYASTSGRSNSVSKSTGYPSRGPGFHSQPTHGSSNPSVAGQWWRTPLIPALRRQRQADLFEIKASLVYRARFRTNFLHSY